jgi:hypothetical protein
MFMVEQVDAVLIVLQYEVYAMSDTFLHARSLTSAAVPGTKLDLILKSAII